MSKWLFDNSSIVSLEKKSDGGFQTGLPWALRARETLQRCPMALSRR
ncbi:hypothetical protein RSSM_06594 [Rhodopirellula sallentina SM41]|uniref:Uncharacterized protein n=1 Tax=Rhodopirellula sallentina SM41 TaxID=1263870 RepID=M5U281_9BACT|nr:hypothetical protein RSSM_06594 [Rhodopirellula sallentina SM41]